MPHTRLRPSFPFTEERLAQLRAVIPEAFADGKVNWTVLREALGESLEDEGKQAEQFGLFWPGKRAARTFAALPSRGTLARAQGEGIMEDSTRHLFIEGDNLEVLKLLQKAYATRVKVIYIDPPYNTGNDFVYSDRFTDPLPEYRLKSGQLDEEGAPLTTNTRADGRFHSNWLSMMYPRLRLAARILADDGFLLVSIDDNEVHHLRQLMNELLGEESFVACFVWHRRPIPDSRNESKASTDHEYVLCYRKAPLPLRGLDRDPTLFENPDNDPRGPWTSTDLTGLATKDLRPNLHYSITDPETGKTYPPSPERGWAISREKFEQLIAERRILWPSKPTGRPRLKRFYSEKQHDRTSVSSMLKDVGHTQDGTREIQELFGEKVMSFPKPTKLIRFLVQQVTESDSLVLDFFAGSATTAHAVLELNQLDQGTRQVILVQLPEPVPVDSVPARAGFANIAEVGKERWRRAAKQLLQNGRRKGATQDLGFRVFKLRRSHFRAWEDYHGGNAAELEDLFTRWESPLEDGWNSDDLLTEVMLLEGFPLDGTMEKLRLKSNKVTIVKSDHCGHRLLVCLDGNMGDSTVDELQMEPGDVLVCLDNALDDAQKVRLSDRCNLKTI